MNPDSSAAKVTGYGLGDQGSVPGRNFSLRNHIHVGFRVHPVSYPVDTVSSFFCIKADEA
jgi:hypothetical protein